MSKRELLAGLTLIPLLMTSSCAQKVQQINTGLLESELASRVGVSLDYVADAVTGFVFISINNPNEYDLEGWLITKHSADGERVTREHMFYQGDDKSRRDIFKVSLPGLGVKEVFTVRINSDDKLLIETQPLETGRVL